MYNLPKISFFIPANAACPPQQLNTTQVLTLPPQNVTEGDSCVFNISRPTNGSNHFTTLTLTNIIMAMENNDTLTIYDGSEEDSNKLIRITKDTGMCFNFVLYFKEDFYLI